MSEKVTVTITGKAGTGKSAIGQLISNKLTEVGIDTYLINAECRPRTDEDLAACIQTLSKQGFAVNIIEHQTKRTDRGQELE